MYSYYSRRKRAAASRSALDNHQATQPEMNLYAITGSVQITRSNQSEQPQTNLHESVPEDTATYTSDDTHVYDNNRQTVTPPGDTHVYYNEQSGVRGAKKPQNLQTSRDVALDKLYSKPNKQTKPLNDSEDYEFVWAAGRSGGAEETNVKNQDLDYIDIDHNVSPVQRSEGVSTRSPEVTYTEVQPKVGDNDMQMVENELYN